MIFSCPSRPNNCVPTFQHPFNRNDLDSIVSFYEPNAVLALADLCRDQVPFAKRIA